MNRRSISIAGAVLVVLSIHGAIAAAQTAPPSTVYRLTQQSAFEQGCFAPCECPIFEAAVQGTFILTPTGNNGLFQSYAVTDVAWTISEHSQQVFVTGSGTYETGGEFAAQQRLELDLQIGGQSVQHFDSGLVPPGAPFPDISVTISENGMRCFDTVFIVNAAPSGMATQTATPTPSPTPAPTPTGTAAPTPTPTSLPTPSTTLSSTPTSSPTPGATLSSTPTPTATPTALPPVCSDARASSPTLWPPNHKFVPERVRRVTGGTATVSIVITSIQQNEPVKRGHNTCPDGTGVGTAVAHVRAERDGGGHGRVYHIGFAATDSTGASCSGVVTVCVPHDQGRRSHCGDEPTLYDSTRCP